MPIGYLDVPVGADLDTKKKLVSELYDAMHAVYPFPDDTRIFLREWTAESVSQNGLLGSEPARPVFTMIIPKGGDLDARRTMLRKINTAVTTVYPLPDFATFLQEHSLDTVVMNGVIQADDRQRVEDQVEAYGE